MSVSQVSLGQLSPKMSLGGVYMLGSVGSPHTERTTEGQGQEQSMFFLQHILSTISVIFTAACGVGFLTHR